MLFSPCCSWRVGWLAIHDRCGAFAEIRRGLFALTQLILGANSIAVSALPAILTPIPGSHEASLLQEFHRDVLARLEEHANFTSEALSGIPGLRVVKPQGAMYVMVGIEVAHFTDIVDDVEFAQKLVAEENVLVLPGAAFAIPNFVRIVFCAPKEKLSEAFERMAGFCKRHAAPGVTSLTSPASTSTSLTSPSALPGLDA